MADQKQQTNGTSLRWLAGLLFTIIIAILSCLVNNVIANDKKNTDEHIRLESSSSGKVSDLRKEIKQDLKEIQATQTEQGKQLAVILSEIRNMRSN